MGWRRTAIFGRRPRSPECPLRVKTAGRQLGERTAACLALRPKPASLVSARPGYKPNVWFQRVSVDQGDRSPIMRHRRSVSGVSDVSFGNALT